MRPVFIATVLAAPLLLLAPFAQAYECPHAQDRQLELDLAGVRTITFEVNSHDLVLDAVAGTGGKLAGRACADDADDLAGLTLSQRKQGDALVVSLQNEQHKGWSFFNQGMARLHISGQVPADRTIHLKVDSGDASLDGASIASVSVGSGDAQLSNTRGLVAAKVGSGDIKVRQAGALKVTSIGSGDLESASVAGPATVDSIGSGEFSLRGGKGDVHIGSLGSGDIDLRDVTGNVEIRSIGSGDADIRQVTGNLTVASVGSGSVDHQQVGGRIDVAE
ncbi:DUF4097 family beta strand repeat-containing protein [Pseudoxanthomonas dokdonensis]|uniref:DUF4097 domain-containing protein n=1 Tax=Pseudoxanthomonas dokdonensis TaxID=344882 RepID=A0A0R0CKU8_9GAMM|nr:DUF2807 domain-containing protein [Pseudoxanthomonas dokdonensis]KRG70653.1 hypothetical protein ABB29_06235 [Pseudoxanthomonas dokdonensis]